MKTIVPFVLIGWIMAIGYGQAMPLKGENWNRGKLELVSGALLDGELSYNWKAEIVQVRLTDGTVKAYSAFQVNRFAFFDTDHNALRTFASINFPVTSTLDRRLFLEEYTVGPMTVYRRLRHQHEPIRIASSTQYGLDEVVYDDLDSFIYYVYGSDESVTELTRFDRELWPRMRDEFGPQLNQYRISQHLDTGSTLARLLLIAHYNTLKSVSLAASAPSEVEFGKQD